MIRQELWDKNLRDQVFGQIYFLLLFKILDQQIINEITRISKQFRIRYQGYNAFAILSQNQINQLLIQKYKINDIAFKQQALNHLIHIFQLIEEVDEIISYLNYIKKKKFYKFLNLYSDEQKSLFIECIYQILINSPNSSISRKGLNKIDLLIHVKKFFYQVSFTVGQIKQNWFMKFSFYLLTIPENQYFDLYYMKNYVKLTNYILKHLKEEQIINKIKTQSWTLIKQYINKSSEFYFYPFLKSKEFYIGMDNNLFKLIITNILILKISDKKQNCYQKTFLKSFKIISQNQQQILDSTEKQQVFEELIKFISKQYQEFTYSNNSQQINNFLIIQIIILYINYSDQLQDDLQIAILNSLNKETYKKLVSEVKLSYGIKLLFDIEKFVFKFNKAQKEINTKEFFEDCQKTYIYIKQTDQNLNKIKQMEGKDYPINELNKDLKSPKMLYIDLFDQHKSIMHYLFKQYRIKWDIIKYSTTDKLDQLKRKVKRLIKKKGTNFEKIKQNIKI